MHRTHKKSVLAGTALATMALTFSSIGVAADSHVGGVPATPSGYAELDAALGEEPRKASAAIELIETGAQAPVLKRRLAKGLEILRERVA